MPKMQLNSVIAMLSSAFRCGGDVSDARSAQEIAGSVQEHQHHDGAASEGRQDLRAGRHHPAMRRRRGEELGKLEVYFLSPEAHFFGAKCARCRFAVGLRRGRGMVWV